MEMATLQYAGGSKPIKYALKFKPQNPGFRFFCTVNLLSVCMWTDEVKHEAGDVDAPSTPSAGPPGLICDFTPPLLPIHLLLRPLQVLTFIIYICSDIWLVAYFAPVDNIHYSVRLGCLHTNSLVPLALPNYLRMILMIFPITPHQ